VDPSELNAAAQPASIQISFFWGSVQPSQAKEKSFVARKILSSFPPIPMGQCFMTPQTQQGESTHEDSIEG
jgi:hypothetical protein